MSYLVILIPFLGLISINLLPKKIRANVAFWTCLLICLLQGIIALSFPSGVWDKVIFSRLEGLLDFDLFINTAGIIVLLTAALVCASALLTGQSMIKDEEDRYDFVNLLLISLIGINGIVLVNDIFTLYIFVEVVAISSFIMICLLNRKNALEGAFKYLILSVVASVLMLTSIALFLLVATGTTGLAIFTSFFTPGGAVISKIALALFVGGLLIKSGVVPFHGWLPDAYSSAPAPVSIFLAGIVTKVSGVYALFKIISMTGGCVAQIYPLLLAFGALSIVVGALAAIGQKDMKRMLAYSSISQVGYIVLAFGINTRLGIIAALFHFFNHAVFKAQLFANCAAVEEQTGSVEMDKMGGLAERMPVTGITSAIAALSTAGLPPLSGFWSKLLIVIALWASGHYFYAALAVLASLLTLAYFLSWQRQVFFGELTEEMKKVTEAKIGLLIPAVFLCGITIGLGLLLPLLYLLGARQ